MDEVGAKGDIADWIMKEKGESKGGRIGLRTRNTGVRTTKGN